MPVKQKPYATLAETNIQLVSANELIFDHLWIFWH